ncbi:peptidase S15 [Aeromicrobium sp. Root344]|uniref:alpha/beta hydrolase n=1 Tax=Aeromicrobium sp. Root344 TaxID=1736521 RepID=UPI0006F33D61|nr:alpha/beta fold hydrolase [Aeromicrobium sp. Root344]KQV74764.1 peptidase S15 [Aeromicrobium sp. Root344]
MSEHRDVAFLSAGVRCGAWHLTAAHEQLGGRGGRPCVVMAHGFGGTRDTGLLGYAEGFAAAGFDVLLFDYRGFGTSEGAPRQRVSHRHQRADYQAAIATARALPGVDDERIVLWGTSYSGGHVIPVAVDDGRIAAIVSMTPAVDGAAALLALARAHPTTLLPLVAHGLRDATRALLRRPPHHLPVVGVPGSTAMITAPGGFEGYHAIAGDTWRNEVCARVALEVAFNRPTRSAARLRTPVLVQVGEQDAVAPPTAAWRAAKKAGSYAEVRNYPVDHFDVYEGTWQRQLLADQIEFLTAAC